MCRDDGVVSGRGQRGGSGRGEMMEGRDEGLEGTGRWGEMMGHEYRQNETKGRPWPGPILPKKVTKPLFCGLREEPC